MKSVIAFSLSFVVCLLLIYIGTVFVLWDWSLSAFGDIEMGLRFICLIIYTILILMSMSFSAFIAAAVDD